MNYHFSQEFAQKMDQEDPLRRFRDEFHIPRDNGKQVHYFTGNSLRLQPRVTEEFLNEELTRWKDEGVEGHFRGKNSWFESHKYSKQVLGDLVGAGSSEVVAMNNLTVNLHLMMVSFYRPTKERYKIVMEAGAFPSDQYAVESQVMFHGFDPEEAIIELTPREGESILRTEDILATIESNGPQVALILVGGVQYFTGQFFDMRSITRVGHTVGANVGFDLAHAIGNVPLELHDIGADFAVWCTYKYLNSGPGSVGGVFVHERHANNDTLPRFAGWWGHNQEKRFLMEKGFEPMPGADGWQLSNVNVLSNVALMASLSVFAQTNIDKLREKSEKLTGYLEFLIEVIKEETKSDLSILTPRQFDERGCQLSIGVGNSGKQVFEYLMKNRCVLDWRESNPEQSEYGVMRAAPVPLYNSFEDVYMLGSRLKEALNNIA